MNAIHPRKYPNLRLGLSSFRARLSWPVVVSALLAVALSACASLGGPGSGEAGPHDLATADGRRVTVAAIDHHVRRYFAHWEGVPDLDYSAALKDFHNAAVAAPGRRELVFATMRFLALLENGHTDAGDSRIWRELGAPLPFTLRHTEGEWIVAASREGRLSAGAVVREIDGEPFEAFYQRARRLLSASTEHSARRRLGSRPFLFPERFVLTLSDGRSVQVERVAPLPGPTPADAAEARDPVPHRWLGQDSIALLRLATFGRSEVEGRALELLGSDIGRARALVLDLRGNGGGNTPWKLRKALLRGRGGHSWRWQTIEDNTPSSLLMRLGAPIVLRLYSPPRWEGPVVLLVDAGCLSACEDLVGSLRGAPGVRIVGETTGGSTGQPIPLTPVEGFSLRVGARRVALPDGTPFEGLGISPDVPAARTIESYRTGDDPALVAARAEASRLVRIHAAQAGTAGDPPADRSFSTTVSTASTNVSR